VSVSGGSTETRRRKAGSRQLPAARTGSRSLKDALYEAGLGDARAEPRPRPQETAPPPDMRPAASALAMPRVPLFADDETPPLRPQPAYGGVAPGAVIQGMTQGAVAQQGATQGLVTQVVVTQGVVSPPPWLRAARRGRRHARLLNTFGWVMTLAVAGTIIGVAGRYLAVTPGGLESLQHARQ